MANSSITEEQLNALIQGKERHPGWKFTDGKIISTLTFPVSGLSVEIIQYRGFFEGHPGKTWDRIYVFKHAESSITLTHDEGLLVRKFAGPWDVGVSKDYPISKHYAAVLQVNKETDG